MGKLRQRVQVLPSRASVKPSLLASLPGGFLDPPPTSPTLPSGQPALKVPLSRFQLERDREWGLKGLCAAKPSTLLTGCQPGRGWRAQLPICPLQKSRLMPEQCFSPLSSRSTIQNMLSLLTSTEYELCAKQSAWHFTHLFFLNTPNKPLRKGLIHSHFTDWETGPPIVVRALLSVPKLVSSRVRMGPRTV